MAAKPSTKIEVHGVKGLRSTPFRKVFASQAAFEKWLDSTAGQNATIHATREGV